MEGMHASVQALGADGPTQQAGAVAEIIIDVHTHSSCLEISTAGRARP
jgi:hypothetical protein